LQNTLKTTMPIILKEQDFKRLTRKRRLKRIKKITPRSRIPEKFVISKMEDLWGSVVLPSVNRIEDRVKKGNLQDFDQFLQSELTMSQSIAGQFTPYIIDAWKLAVSKETRMAMMRALSRSLGIDITAIFDGIAVKNVITRQSIEMALLIRSVPENVILSVSDAVTKNLQGIPLPAGRNLIEQIHEIGNFSLTRSKIIARDQSSKLTSLLNQARQQEVGITTYIWHNVHDERVVGNPEGVYPIGNDKHGDHWIMEGLYCRWDDPTVYSPDNVNWFKRTKDMPKKHPGIEIMCRCFAEPVIDINEILNSAEVQ
jgi:hypothetical protein